jgi:hypothetical protein
VWYLLVLLALQQWTCTYTKGAPIQCRKERNWKIYHSIAVQLTSSLLSHMFSNLLFLPVTTAVLDVWGEWVLCATTKINIIKLHALSTLRNVKNN